MCSPYDYMEEKKKKKELGMINNNNSGITPITTTVNKNNDNCKIPMLSALTIVSKSKSSSTAAVVVPSPTSVNGVIIIPKLNTANNFFSTRKSRPLSSNIFLFVLILLALEFFALADSAAVTNNQEEKTRILNQNNNEKLVLITPTTVQTTLSSPDEEDYVNHRIVFFSSLNNQNNENIKKKRTSGHSHHDVDSSSRPTTIDEEAEVKLQYFTMDPTEQNNCTEPTILDFPPDLVTDLPYGGSLLVHILISVYIFYSIAYLCDAFFVPSIELICKVLHVPSDVAGATFMAIATSSPEFFTNIIGTFVTKGDIGVGSVVGSVVFNLLAIVAWCGLAAKAALKIDWWPLTRDIFFYVLSVLFLITFLWDGLIVWYEALLLVLGYCAYITVICNNSKVQRIVENWIQKDNKTMTTTNLPVPSQERLRELLICSLSYDGFKSSNESTPLLSDKSGRYMLKPALSSTDGSINCNSESFHGGNNLPKNNVSQHHHYQNLKNSLEKVQEQDDENLSKKSHDTEIGLFELPRGQSCLKWFEWVMGWPVRLILHLTIPDCRLLKNANWYPVTFVMCIVYMAIFSYVITWMMTVIGQILGIPDAIVGLTFVAVGTSLPEAVSSIIVARQGLGTMSISNSVGSNTFNILLCLGLPWLLRNAMLAMSGATEISIPMTSGGFGSVSIYLVASAILIYMIIAWNNFLLDAKVGIFSLFMYILFLILASLLELNFFFPVNLPTCKI